MNQPEFVAPNKESSERFVLGELMTNHNLLADVEGILSTEMFYIAAHRKIYATMISNHRQSLGTDPVTISENDSELDLDQLVSMMTEYIGVGMDLKTHAKAIRETYSLRQLIVATKDALRLCYSADTKATDVAAALQSAAAAADRIAETGKRKTAQMLTDYNPIHQQIIDDRQEGKGAPGIATGLPDIDRKIIQCNAGWLWVIGASPGTGKTALFLNFVNNILMKNIEKRILIFSVEMPIADIYDRSLALKAGVDLHEIRTGTYSIASRQRLAEAGYMFERSKVMIDDDGSITTDNIRARIRQYEREHGSVDLIVVDYLQIVRTAEKGEMRAVAIGNIAMELKSIAKEHSASVIALSQLSRAPKTAPDREPTMSDLKESGTIEAASDIVSLLHQPREPKPGYENTVKVIIDKNRAGEKGSLHLHFNGSRMQFTSFEPRDMGEPRYDQYAQYNQ